MGGDALAAAERRPARRVLLALTETASRRPPQAAGRGPRAWPRGAARARGSCATTVTSTFAMA